jgi:RNA-binding protein Musashi
MDKDTGRPRGFGFVTFDGDAAVDACLQGPLQILGKPIEVKRAQPRGNMREEEENKKFGRGGGKFGGRDAGFKSEGGGFEAGQNANQGGVNGSMTPAMMAQYWQRMQEYFRTMQQNMAGQGPAMPNPMMGGMNPAMMGMMQGMNQGGGGPQMGGMNPAMMGNFDPSFNQGQFNDPNQGGAYGGNAGNQGGPRPAYNAHEQMAFEQQKYQQQEQRRMQQSAGYGGQGGPTSWEGMYDEIPPPTVPSGPGAHRGGFGGKNSRARQGSSAPPNAPNAPANAPTGPKNAGKPYSNYRGGGRGGVNNFRHNPYGGRG